MAHRQEEGVQRADLELQQMKGGEAVDRTLSDRPSQSQVFGVQPGELLGGPGRRVLPKRVHRDVWWQLWR